VIMPRGQLRDTTHRCECPDDRKRRETAKDTAEPRVLIVSEQAQSSPLTPSVMSCPGTCTFMPHRPVTRFIGLRVQRGVDKGQLDSHQHGTERGELPATSQRRFNPKSTVGSCRTHESTSLIWLFASVISIEIWAR
jgi:hypothetical protein